MGFRDSELVLLWDLDINIQTPPPHRHDTTAIIQHPVHLATQLKSTAVFARRAMDFQERPAFDSRNFRRLNVEKNAMNIFFLC
jgi:hypothetical protein